MISILMMAFYYIVLPFCLAALLLKLLRRYGARPLAPDIAELCAKSPIQKKSFRALRRDGQGLALLGDFETQPEAVEAAYRGKEAALRSGAKASFLVLNDKAETLEQIDA